MRNPASMGANALPAVGEDVHSGSNSLAGSGSLASGSQGSHRSASLGASLSGQAPRMKRSPYLSVMAGSTKSSEDLVVALSRPAPGGLRRTSGGGTAGGARLEEGGRPTVESEEFFRLQRPSSSSAAAADPSVAAAGRAAEEVEMGDQRPRSNSNALRSALRSSSRADVDAAHAASAAAPPELKKSASVTFSETTKRASHLGIAADSAPQMANFGNAASLRAFRPARLQPKVKTAAMMMKKSSSVAAPQFLLAHQNSVSSGASANESFNVREASGGNASAAEESAAGGDCNASFPIYLGRLDGGDQAAGPNAPPGRPQHQRQRSKSTNALQYYYQSHSVTMDPAQQLLHAAGMADGVAGTGALVARPSIHGLHLTFRDMLDEGDGAEGDLNVRRRNQQWKDFRSFSSQFASDNPFVSLMGDSSRSGSPVKEAGSVGSHTTSATAQSSLPLSGSKRTLTPSSLTSASTAASSGAGGNKGFASAGTGHPRVGGAHRSAVSANDLAMLRRAASRMKMTPVGADAAPPFGATRPRAQRSGETLGGDLLSRLSDSSAASLEGGEGVPATVSAPAAKAPSPLEQMVAQSRALRSSAVRAPLLGDLVPSSGTSGLPRRVRTVGAGLAYGHAGMTVDYRGGGCRVSKFNLGALRNSSKLSEISSAGSSGGGRNEEWDLS
ncbi:hypothetical protein ACHAXT_002630 [Thalassiosira profunda]